MTMYLPQNDLKETGSLTIDNIQADPVVTL